MSGLLPAIRRPSAARAGAGAAGLCGVAALAGATASTVIEITVGTTTRLANLDTELSGWDRHGPALLVVAAFALLMLVGALRGARPAMAAVVACGAAALLIALGADAPRLNDTGQVGEFYTDASAGPHAGFWLEVVGGTLLVAAGAALLSARAAELRSGAVVRRGARGRASRGQGTSAEARALE
jgi:hypothetical protein